MLEKGDTVRVVGETSVTARIVGIGPDPTCADDLVRYHLHVHPDDVGIIWGDDLAEQMLPPYKMSVPVTSPKIKLYKI